uniref:Aromatic amino acid beta-eliminating lyase/threonine aldolase domain-containing protein n=1 Tax=Leptobrachium leishanense TaxID=445787 RepID=A0A8C5QZI2_9ANUR
MAAGPGVGLRFCWKILRGHTLGCCRCRSIPNTVTLRSSYHLAMAAGARTMYGFSGAPGHSQAHVVDLRSDTITRPCAEMRRAMAEAEVGDDVFGEDPTVNVMCHCRSRGVEVLIGDESHICMYEQGSSAQIAGVFARPVRTLQDGRLDLQDLESKIQHSYPDVHVGQTRLICLENTHNRMGGRVLPVSYMKEVRDLADRYGLKVHLDGARLLNAAFSLDVEPAQIVQYCDSVSLCLSKGLGAPVGSLLGGRADFIAEARRMRKVLGGGMRQAGVLAAAGLVALNRAKENLLLDHRNAMVFSKGVQELGSPLCTTDPDTVESNMVLLRLNSKLGAQELCEQLSTVTPAELETGQVASLRALPFSSTIVRLVWHRDISESDTLQALAKLRLVLQRYND